MDAIISDTTGKTVAKTVSYKVDVLSRSTGLHFEFDTEFNEQMQNLVSLAIENGRKWYRLTKNDSTGRWEKLEPASQPLF